MAMLSKNVAKGTHLMIKLPLNFLTPAVKNRYKKALMNESLQPRDIYANFLQIKFTVTTRIDTCNEV